jgi:hypothetical protein
VITAEDLALAQELLASRRVDAAAIESAIASLGAANAGKRLREVLEERGHLRREDGYAPTLVPGEAVARGPASVRTLVPDGSKSPTRVPLVAGGEPKPTRRIGRYEIVEEVARGGMGIVYRAFEPSLNRHVALKVLLAGAAAGKDQIERFLREARSAAGLQHPNIVQVFEVGEDGLQKYFAMEFVEGTSLDRLLKEQGRLPPRTAVRAARDIARALHFAHQKGVVHRDVKPGNIMVASAGRDASGSTPGSRDAKPLRVLLGDFGLARDASASALTVSGNLLGTPAYMSPEQAAGRTAATDARSDVFALGAVLYEALTGRPAFEGSSLGDVLAEVLRASPRPLRRVRPELSRDLEVVVHKALAREPERRYQTAGDFADDLDRWLNGEAVLAEAPSLAFRVSRWARARAPLVAAASVVALALIGGGALLAAGSARRARDERERAETAARQASRKAEEALAEASRLTNENRFTEARDFIETARSLSPLHPGVEPAARSLRLARALDDIGRIAALPDPTPEDSATGHALLETAAEFRDEPEVRRLARLIAGTCTWSVGECEEGLDVDLGEGEPGILWDEETFPPLEDARRLGLCRPVGETPLAPRDISAGGHLVVLSRAGRVVRVIPVYLRRSSTLALAPRAFRVGSSPAATHARIEDALKEAGPGATIELEEGDHIAPTFGFKPGTVLFGAGSGRTRVRGTKGPAIAGPAAHGLRIRDLDLEKTGDHSVILTDARWPSLIRVGIRDSEALAVEFARCSDWHLRDCDFRRTAAMTVNAHASAGGLAVGLAAEGGDWACLYAGGRDNRFLRCTFTGGKLACLHLGGPGVELRECTFRDGPNWGVILEQGADRFHVSDCLFVNCARTCSGAKHGPLVLNGGDGGVAEHNTIWGSVVTGIYVLGGHRVTGNLIAGIRPFTNPGGGVRPGAALIVARSDPPPEIDHTVIWDCEVAAVVDFRTCATPEEASAAGEAALPGSGWAPLARSRVADPRFRNPEAGDFRLGEGSAAAGAAADGADAGVRWAALEADVLTSARRVVRENGRMYVKKAAEALEAGRESDAVRYADRAQTFAPGDPGLPALLKRLKLGR